MEPTREIPSGPPAQPIRTQDSLHLSRSRIQPYNKYNFRLPILVDPFGSTDFLLGPKSDKNVLAYQANIQKKLIYSRLSRILFSVTHTQTTFQLFNEVSTSLVLRIVLYCTWPNFLKARV